MSCQKLLCVVLNANQLAPGLKTYFIPVVQSSCASNVNISILLVHQLAAWLTELTS